MRPRRPWLRRWMRRIGLLVLVCIVLSVVCVLVLRFIAPPTSAFMLARAIEARVNGDRTLRIDYRWTPIEQISAHMPIAAVAAEDQRFPVHRGFDVDAIRTALADAEEGARLRGASTISQQVAKNLFLWNGRSYVRKGLEVWFTVLIEFLWPKQRIIEVYLNIAEFGDGIYGVGAASQRYYGRPPDALDARQAALLMAVVPSPRRLHVDRPSAYVQGRAAWIQRQMNQLGGPGYLDR